VKLLDLLDLLDDNQQRVLVACVLIFAGVASLHSYQGRQRALAPIVLLATATPPLPTIPVAATPSGPTLPRAVIAYAAPDGIVLGAIEPGRAYRLAARSGDFWLQLDVADSGLVWVRASDLPEIAAPDLATPVSQPTPAPIYIAPVPAMPAAPEAPVAPVPTPAQMAPLPTVPAIQQNTIR
jgi:hypothetical protein